MNRKLVIVNLALVFAVAYAGVRVREQMRNARQREDAVLKKRAKAPQPPQFAPIPPAKAVMPSAYIDVAQKMLFDKSRNSTVVIETAPPEPPKPVPPLPSYHGQMNLGDGPMVILSTGKAGHQTIRVGEMIGPFKLVEATERELTFEWEEKMIRKSVDELVDRGTAAQQVAASPQTSSKADSAPSRQTAPTPSKLIGPGQDTGVGFRSCNPNDGYPNGAVVEGYRRIDTVTPFGIQCRWEPVRQ